jgi:N-acetylmuramoyl-L-alanine amidase
MRLKNFLFLTLLTCALFLPASLHAAVEIGWSGANPTTIEDVYQREGTSFIALEDVLAALEMEGVWDSVAHVYRIRTAHGWAVISPGSQFLRLGEEFLPITHRPRFIDGKLRVSEDFVLRQFASLLSEPIQYRNYNPSSEVVTEDPLDRLFAFLLRRKPQSADSSQWTVAIDPGHGGVDNGVIGLDGSKEKVVTLDVARRLERLLKMHQDAPVLMTRDDDYTLDGEHRLQAVAQAGADVLLSLHAQGFPAESMHGVMLFVQPETERDAPQGMAGENLSRKLADGLARALEDAGFVVAGVAERPVLPLGRGDLPRVLVEMGSLSNNADLAMLHDPDRQQDLARALSDGLQAFFKTDKDSE